MIFLKKISIFLFCLLLLTGCFLESDEKKAENYYSQAEQALQQGKQNEAIIWLQKAIQKKNNMAKAHYQLGRLYRETGKINLAYLELNQAIAFDNHYKKAKKELAFFLAEQNAPNRVITVCKQYLKEEGDDPDIAIVMGSTLIILRQYDKAVDLLQKYIKKFPERAELAVTLSRALFASGARKEARQLMEKTAHKFSKDLYVQLALSSLYGQMGLKQLQLTTLKKITTDFPRHAEPYLARTRFWLRQQEPDKAFDVLDKALAAGVETVDIHQMLAMLALRMKKWSIAEEHFKKAVSIASGQKRIGSQLLLADYLIFQQRFAEAEAILEPLLEHDSQNISLSVIYSKLVNLYMAEKKFAKARKMVDTFARKLSGSPVAHLLRGKLYLLDGKIKDARKEFALASKLDPRSGESQFLYGLTFMNESKKISMAEILQALKKNPGMLKAHLALSQLYAADNQTEKALEEINLVLAKRPDHVKSRMFRVTLLLRKGEIEKALKDVRYLVSKYPDNATYLLKLAEILSGTGETEKAEEIYLSLQRKMPDNVKILDKLVSLYIRSKKYDQALAAVDRFQDRFPDNRESPLVKARIYMAKNQLNKAEQIITRVADQDSENPVPQVMLGNLYGKQDDMNRAIAAYNRALALNPEDIGTRMHLADLYMKQKKISQAMAQYEKILDQKPSFLPALNNLLFLYTQSGHNMERGLELAKKLAATNTESPSILDTIGWFYVQKGAYDQAGKYLLQALAKDSSPLIRYQLGILRYRQQRWNKATLLLQQSIKQGIPSDAREKAATVLSTIDNVNKTVATCRQLRGAGHHEQAEEVLEQLLKNEGFSIDAAIELATVLADKKQNLQRAEKLARQACDETCEVNPKAADVLGWVYLQQGKYLLARRYLQQAAEAQPEEPLFLYHYGVLLYATKKIEESEKMLRKAMGGHLDNYDRTNALELLGKMKDMKKDQKPSEKSAWFTAGLRCGFFT